MVHHTISVIKAPKEGQSFGPSCKDNTAHLIIWGRLLKIGSISKALEADSHRLFFWLIMQKQWTYCKQTILLQWRLLNSSEFHSLFLSCKNQKPLSWSLFDWKGLWKGEKSGARVSYRSMLRSIFLVFCIFMALSNDILLMTFFRKSLSLQSFFRLQTCLWH